MATIDLSNGLGTGHPAILTRTVPYVVRKTINLSTAATSKGSALAAADVIEALDIPAGTVIMNAGIKVITAQTGSTVLTLDLGVTGIDADNFVDGFDYFAAAAGAYAQNAAAFQPIVIGATADTLDVLIATLTTTNTGGTFEVWALLVDVNSKPAAPGIAAIGS